MKDHMREEERTKRREYVRERVKGECGEKERRDRG
jgi:hypothetical protein